MSTFLKNIVFRLNVSVKNKTPGIKYHRNKYITEDSYHFVSLCSNLAVSDILHSQAPVYQKTANLFGGDFSSWTASASALLLSEKYTYFYVKYENLFVKRRFDCHDLRILKCKQTTYL